MATKRNFVSPIETGNIEFIRPSKLEKPGVIVEATYVESLPNAFDNNKLDYKHIQNYLNLEHNPELIVNKLNEILNND